MNKDNLPFESEDVKRERLAKASKEWIYQCGVLSGSPLPISPPPVVDPNRPGSAPPGCSQAAPKGVSPFLVRKSHNCNGVSHKNGQKSSLVLAKYEKKASFVIQLNVTRMVELVGLEKVGFLTLTTPAGGGCSYWSKDGWKEAQRRYKSFMTGAYPEIFGKMSKHVVVLEPQQRGEVHWHILVECEGDIRTGVNFEELKNRNYSSASKLLKGYWKKLRESCCVYGLGRHELLPIRSSKEAISNYVGWYIGKGLAREKTELEFEGLKRPYASRRVRYSRGYWRGATYNFSWVGSGRKWRDALAYVSQSMGINSIDDWTRRFGARWAYQLGESIMSAYEREVLKSKDVYKVDNKAFESKESVENNEVDFFVDTVRG